MYTQTNFNIYVRACDCLMGELIAAAFAHTVGAFDRVAEQLLSEVWGGRQTQLCVLVLFDACSGCAENY